MIEEKDIKAIYEGFYKIAEAMGESDYTHEINWQLHLQLTNRIGPIEGSSEEIRKLNGIALKLREEYWPKFEGLEKRQKTLEAQLA